MASGPGEHPDLAVSPEVLIWTWMLSFSGAGEGGDEEEAAKVDRSSPRVLSRSWAFFSVSTLETHHRLGILARFLQCPMKIDLVSF